MRQRRLEHDFAPMAFGKVVDQRRLKPMRHVMHRPFQMLKTWRTHRGQDNEISPQAHRTADACLLGASHCHVGACPSRNPHLSKRMSARVLLLCTESCIAKPNLGWSRCNPARHQWPPVARECVGWADRRLDPGDAQRPSARSPHPQRWGSPAGSPQPSTSFGWFRARRRQRASATSPALCPSRGSPHNRPSSHSTSRITRIRPRIPLGP